MEFKDLFDTPPSYPISSSFAEITLLSYPVPSCLSGKGSPVSQLESLSVGQRVTDIIVRVSGLTHGSGTNDRPFARFICGDAQNSIKSVAWENTPGFVESVEKTIESGNIFRVFGKVDEFPKGSGNLQLNVDKLVLDEEADPVQFLPSALSKYDYQREMLELLYLYGTLLEPHRTIVKDGLEMFWDRFRIAPTAKKHHHAFIGGLLVHTSQLAKLVDFMFSHPDGAIAGAEFLVNRIEELCSNFGTDEYYYFTRNYSFDHVRMCLHNLKRSIKDIPDFAANRDVCLSSTFYHDLGKIKEYRYDANGIDMDDEGKLIGHMALGSQYLDQAVVYSPTISHEVLLPIRHIIFSHHGLPEWGSPVRPQTPEAWLFHLADYIGSRIY